MANPLEINPGFLAVAVPNEYVSKPGTNTYRVRLSLVLSPFVSANRELLPEEQKESDYRGYWENKCTILKDWPKLFFPPNQTADTFKFRILNEDGEPLPDAKATYFGPDPTHGGAAYPTITGANDQAAASALWKTIFNTNYTETRPTEVGKWVVDDDGSTVMVEKTGPTGPVLEKVEGTGAPYVFSRKNWVEPYVLPTAGEAQPETRTAASAGSQQGLGSSLRRQNGVVVEGITTGEMNRLVAVGTALQATATNLSHERDATSEADGGTQRQSAASRQAIAAPSLLPEAAKPAWRRALRRVDQVISRQNQLGSAGAESATLAGDRDRKGSKIRKVLKTEFHHRLAIVDDHPALLRLLRLVVDVEVDIELPAAGAPENIRLVPEITLTSDGKSMVGWTRPTVCKVADGVFHAVPATDSRLTADGRCVNPDLLDTVQWDVEGGVRSVLRQNGFQSGSNPDDEGFSPLSSYGLTVFWQFADLGGKSFPWTTGPKPEDNQQKAITTWLEGANLDAFTPSPSWEAHLTPYATGDVKILKLIIPGRFAEKGKTDIWISGELRLKIDAPQVAADAAFISATIQGDKIAFETYDPINPSKSPDGSRPYFAERIDKDGIHLRKYDGRRRFLAALTRDLGNSTTGPLRSNVWKPAAAKPVGDHLWADDLVLGYVPRIAVFKDPKDAAKASDDGMETARWQHLTGRDLFLKFGEGHPLKNAFPYQLEWKDEMALVHTTPEAPQPLAGWVVDVLDVVPDGKVIRFHYLVSTSTGFVVVREDRDPAKADNAAPDDGREEEIAPTVRRGLLASVTSQRKDIALGQYCQFRGNWNTETGCFVASESTLALGKGLAGIIQGTIGTHLIPPTEQGVPSQGIVKIPLAVKSASYKLIHEGMTDAAGLLTKSELTYVFLRGANKPAEQWNTASDFRYFQGRGEAALIVADDIAKVSDASKAQPLRVPLLPVQGRYLRREGALHVFSLVDDFASSTRKERQRDVKINLAEGAKVSTLANPTGSAADLSVNGIYQIAAAMKTLPDGRVEIQAVEIVELSPGVSGTYLGMELVGGRWIASFSLAGGATVRCPIDKDREPIVSFTFPSSEDEAPWPTSSQGKWFEMGMRLDPQTMCHLTLGPRNPANGEYPLARVDASWPASTNTFFAFVTGLPLPGRRFTVDRIVPRTEQRPDGLWKDHLLEMGADCEILSLPPALPTDKPWRRRYHLPQGCLAKLTVTDGVVRDAEVINSLQSPLIRLEKDAVFLNLPGSTDAARRFVLETSVAKLVAPWLQQMQAKVGVAPQSIISPAWQSSVVIAADATVVSLQLVIPGAVETREKDGWSDGERWVPLEDAQIDPETVPDLKKAQELVFTFGSAEKVRVGGAEKKEVPTGEFTVQIRDVTIVRQENPPVIIEHRALALILTGEGSGNVALQAGNYIPLFFEAFSSSSDPGEGARVVERRKKYSDLIDAAVASGFPLAVDAQHGLVIDAADQNSADWEIVSASSPQQQDLAGIRQVKVEQKIPQAEGAEPVIQLRPFYWKETYPVSVLDSATWMTGKSEDGGDAEKKQYFQMFFSGEGKLKWPLYETASIEVAVANAGAPAIPKNDQVIADDVLFHWNGWSLAADPDHRVIRREGETINSTAAPLIPVKVLSAKSLPRQRLGAGMRIHVTVMDLAGNSRKVPDRRESLLFRPFGRVSEASHPQEPEPSFLRFMPTGAPLVWRKDLLPGPPKNNSKGKSNANGKAGGGAGAVATAKGKGEGGSSSGAKEEDGEETSQEDPALPAEIVLLSDRAKMLSDLKGLPSDDPRVLLGARVSRADVEISLLPPPVHWSHAQTWGCFDGEGAKNSYDRITGGTDWGHAKLWLDPKSEGRPDKKDWSPLTDSVADPHVRGFLIHSQAPSGEVLESVVRGKPRSVREGSIRVTSPLENIKPKAPGTPVPVTSLVLAKPVGKDGKVATPAPFNLPGSVTGPIPKTFGASTDCLVFSEDSDVTLRIHGLYEDGQTGAGKYTSHYLTAFAKWASRQLKMPDTGSDPFNILVRAMLLLARDGEDPYRPQDTNFKDLIERLTTFHDGDLASSSFLLHPWVSTPRLLRVRHVTNQPYQAPKLLAMEMVRRLPGSTGAEFRSTFQIHRPSTGFITLQAAIEENYSDDPRSDLPAVPPEEMLRIYEDPELKKKALLEIDKQLAELHLADHMVDRHKGVPLEDVKVLGRTIDRSSVLLRPPLDLSLITPDYPSATHPFEGGDEEHVSFKQEFDDTRHRTVFYRAVSHSRHGKEFFTEDFIETNPRTIHHFEHTDEWARVEVPATVAPADVNVSDISVLFEWSEGGWRDRLWWTNGGDTWEYSRSRRAGHRLWIDRPWYSSGSGEKLAVLLWMNTPRSWEEGQEYAHLVSRWGADPVFETELPSERLKNGDRDIAGLLTREDFIRPWASLLGLRSRTITPADGEEEQEGEKAAAQPGAADAVSVQPGATATAPPVTLPVGLVTYTPRYHPERKQWYVDIFAEPRSYCPFVTYTVARYQPCSLPECALSLPRRLRMLQILPTRTVSVTATCKGLIELKITLAGIFPPQNRRRISVAIEKNPFLEDATDSTNEQDANFNAFELGWEPVPVIGMDGSSGVEVVYHDPLPAPHSRGNGSSHHDLPVSEVVLSVRLQRLPVHVSILKQRDPLSREDPSKYQWNCRYLRLSITEDEIHPYAHAMPEDLREGARRIFADQVLLPRELLAAGRLATEETPEEAAAREKAREEKEKARASAALSLPKPVVAKPTVVPSNRSTTSRTR